jgi:hypothetical protein
MVDQFKFAHADILEIPWGRRKRLITEHIELERIRARHREDAMKAARKRR